MEHAKNSEKEDPFEVVVVVVLVFYGPSTLFRSFWVWSGFKRIHTVPGQAS